MADIVPIKKAPSDLPRILRELANKVEAGTVTDYVSARVEDGSYEFVYAASKSDCLLMATLLQQNCIDKMRA